MFKTFSQHNENPLTQPIFFGAPLNVARYDQQKLAIFERLVEKQISFYWRPEEVDVSRDRIDFQKLSAAEQHIFTSNLKYQTLLDSVQGRSPGIAFLPITSLSEFELWTETWTFFETIHSRSYTHIIRNIYNQPELVLDDIIKNEHIQRRATAITVHYDRLILLTQLWQSKGEGEHVASDGKTYLVTLRELKKALYLCMMAVNALEAIRFYVSFACTFAFCERKLLEGSSKIVRLIARDENLHLTAVQHVINLWRNGKDDPEMQAISQELHDEGRQIFIDAVEQEKEWADYLFEQGSMLGLNAQILKEYVEYIATTRMAVIGFESPYQVSANPLPWMNSYLNSDNVQIAPQEAEVHSYVVGQIDAEVNDNAFEGFEL